MWHDPRFWNALRNTAVYTAVVVPGQVGLGLALAVALQRNSLVNKFFRSVFFFPVISALATMGIVWKFLLDPQIGIITHAAGVRRGCRTSLPAEHHLGAARRDRRRHLEERRVLHGDLPGRAPGHSPVGHRGGRRRRRRAVAPVPARHPAHAAPGHAVRLVMATITSMQLFDSVYVMTSGGPLFHTDTLVTYIYQAGSGLPQPATRRPSRGSCSC